MPIALKRASGYLNDPEEVLYTCPALTTAWVGTIVVVNEDTVVRTFELYADPSDALISATPTSLAAGAMYRDTDGHVLVAGDTLKGGSDLDGKCNYRLSVVERT
jgi:hypothetical protein